MRIKKIHITGFGGLKNCELILDDNFNLIHGSNEYGKTTIFAFIRAMLFGLKGNNKAIQDDYTRYLPLDNPQNYCGEMYVEVNGINYKIERNFYRKTRITKITDLDNAKIITEKAWTDLLIPLDFETFSSTCYINSETSYPGQHFMKILQERIIGLAESGSGDILVHSSIDVIHTQQKAIRNKIADLSRLNEFTIVSDKKSIDARISELENARDSFNTNLKLSYAPIILIYSIAVTVFALSFIYLYNPLNIILSMTVTALAFLFNIAQINKLNKERNCLQKDIDFHNGQLKELYSQKSIIEMQLQDCNENKIEIQALSEDLNALQLARDTINSIAKEMYTENTNELNTSLSRTFSFITDNAFRGVFVNEDMQIYAVKEDDTLYSLQHLSRGSLEQLYISLRLVTLDLIYKNLDLPIIVDDGFVHYDYKRYKNTITMLEKSNHQIIIFNLSKSVF